jgi:DNA-binding PucR family transcriptional regulator
MQALGRQGAASSAELGVYGLLLSQAGRGDLDRIVTAELGPLLDYDRRRRTNLIDTLEAYFAGAGNLSRTAQRLHIHVNTLYRRLDRVARLIGADWQEPERALQIHLALRLHLLRERL